MRAPSVLALLFVGSHFQGAVSLSQTTLNAQNLSPNQESLGKAPQFPRTWVPLACTSELDPDRPTKLQFLGQSYVAYRNNDGQWVVVDDACPHRLAPLSEGRVHRESNSLQCSYHGWEFDSSGACQKIPQVNDGVFEAARSNPRCHVKSYSVIVEKHCLFAWLWPEDPLSVAFTKEANPEGIMEGLPSTGSTFTRDLPYSWDTLLENIGDPSHVPFAHHGLQGTRDDAIPINMTMPSNITEWGFSSTFGDRTMKKRRQASMLFRGPFVIQYQGKYDAPPSESKSKQPGSFDLSAVMIPTRPGHSRIMLFTGSPDKKDNSTIIEKEKQRPSLFAKIFQKLPKWLVHTLSNRFLDTDLAFLYYQERERERRGEDVNSFFIPSQSDRSIRAIREWILKYAHVPGLLPPADSYTRDVLFDRWTQHSDQCRHCSQAMASIQIWRKNCYRVLALSILLGKFIFARVVLVGCLALLRLLATAEQSLKKGGFDHYKNH